MKSKSTAAVLAFFLGGLGVHRFYLGQTGLGFLYLFFCWTLIPAFVALIDFVIFLTMGEDSFNAKYNRRFATVAAPTVIVNQSVGSTTNNVNLTDELVRLDDLRQRGLLNQGEFEIQKMKLLSR